MAQETVPFDQGYYQDESFVEAPKPPKLFDPSYLLPRLLYRWHWILIGLVVGLAYGFISIKLATPTYKSQSVVRVKESAAKDSEAAEGSEIILSSKEAVDSVVEKFALSDLRKEIAEDDFIRNLPNLRPPPQKKLMSLIKPDAQADEAANQIPYTIEELTDEINRWVSISSRKNSRLIDIQVFHPSPVVAQRIANRYVHHFQLLREKGFDSDFDEKITNLDRDIRDIIQQLRDDKELQEHYRATLEADKEFAETLKEHEILSLTFVAGGKHPIMIKTETLLKKRRDALQREMSKVINSPDKDYGYWETRRDRLANLEDSEVFKRARNRIINRVEEIKNMIQVRTGVQEAKQERLNDLDRKKDSTQNEIISEEKALLPEFPYSPNRKNMMMKGTVFGLAAGLALAFLFQLADNKIGSVTEAEQAYGLPLLSAIRKLPSEDVMQAEKEALVEMPISFHDVHPNLAVPGFASDPVYSEMFRVLRASISLLGDASERNVTLVSSSIPGEGKTFVAANLALAYAKQGTRTLLIDFDLRKPAQHKIFGQPRHGFQGIVNVLNGSAGLGDVIATFEGFTNLSVIFSGTKSPSPGELLEPAKLYSIIEAYAGNFDHVIIDSAPLLPVPDTRILAPLAHNFCLVCRADHTPRKATYSALELLAADGIQPSGLVLNDFTEKRMQGGKYGYGYGYGEYGETDEEEEEA